MAAGRRKPPKEGKRRRAKSKDQAPKRQTSKFVGRPWAPDDMAASVFVEDFTDQQVYAIGSPGILTLNVFAMQGDERDLQARLHELFCVIEVDLPFYIPIHDDDYAVSIPGEHVRVRHRTKRRGEEEFSTVDTRITPYFSALSIKCEAFLDRPVRSEFDPAGQRAAYFQSLVLIYRVVRRIEEFLTPSLSIRLLDRLPRVSYRVIYAERSTRAAIARTTYPMSGAIEVRSPMDALRVDNNALKDYLAASFQVASFAENTVTPAVRRLPFLQRVFETLHSYAYYCRQHAGSLGSMTEEHLRDLYLIVLKSVFERAEGEPYHFDGKLDFKVTNPDAPHEFVSGELKWWDGPSSGEAVLHQALRKHATGQEAEIHCLLLNRNVDSRAMFEAATTVLEADADIVEGSVAPRVLPTGSREQWVTATARIRGQDILVSLGVADLFYERQ